MLKGLQTVAMVREKCQENEQISRSGSFDVSQENLENLGKVREFQNFP